MNAPAKIAIGHSVCPHDCPSTCALDVELLGDNRIGRVHGAADHSYTAGDMAQAGRDVEKIVLAKALRLVLEERIFLHDNRTIVFE